MFAGINDGGRLAAGRAAAVENQINTGSERILHSARSIDGWLG